MTLCLSFLRFHYESLCKPRRFIRTPLLELESAVLNKPACSNDPQKHRQNLIPPPWEYVFGSIYSVILSPRPDFSKTFFFDHGIPRFALPTVKEMVDAFPLSAILSTLRERMPFRLFSPDHNAYHRRFRDTREKWAKDATRPFVFQPKAPETAENQYKS